MDRKKIMTKRISHAARALAVGVVAALLALIMVQGALAGDWPMFAHDAAHSGEANEVVQPPLKLLWKYQTGCYVSSSPAVSGVVVYVGSTDEYAYVGMKGTVYALDANTGA